MKFSFKLLLWTVMVMAAALGYSGYYFVNYVFETSLARESSQAMDENSILRFAFETAALNVPVKYDVLQDYTVEQISADLEKSNSAGRLLRLSDEEKKALYVSDGFVEDDSLLAQTDEVSRAWQVIRQEDRYYIRTGSTVKALDRVLYLETMRDISGIFTERALGFTVYRRMMMLILAFGALLMHFLSGWLTRPIRQLTNATKRMSLGDYGYRAKKISKDELGQLTEDFNGMANVLEETIRKLEEEIQDREDFVAAFAHELKTPLTSIIGYADILRSRKLDEEKSFLSANYIYTEGKRLETMSLRLLDIIVTKKREVKFTKVSAGLFADWLEEMFSARDEIKIVYSCREGIVWAEVNLIKTVLMNLVDNACKASEPGSTVLVQGVRLEGGYRFLVKDEGIGIPGEEIANITKAFYMVDKSRARSKNGAGLGLALCTEILRLHDSHLEIESEPKKGSCFSFFLPDREERK